MKLKYGDLTKLARQAGCSVTMIREIIYRRRRPSPNLAKTLEKVTGIPRVAWIWPADYKNPMLKRPEKVIRES